MRRALAQERARAEILAAAAPIFAAHGYHGMSMRDLSRATGRGLSSLYNYFSSKQALLFALQRHAFETLICTSVDAIAAPDAPEGKLYAFILNHIRYFTANPDVMRVLVQEARVLPARQRQRVRALKERYFQLARDIVVVLTEQGCLNDESGELGVVNERELDRITYSIFGMLNWIYAWYEPDQHGTPQELARTVHRVTLCGLLARSPNRSIQMAAEREVEQLVLQPLISGGV